MSDVELSELHRHSTPNGEESQLLKPEAEKEKPHVTFREDVVILRNNKHNNHSEEKTGCVNCRKKKKPKNEEDLTDTGAYNRRSVEEPIDGVYDRAGVMTENNELLKPTDPGFHTHVNRRKFDVNMYATKKSAASGLMDLALLMANASQLKHVILTDGAHRFYTLMLTLIITSIILQVILGLALLFLARMRVSEDDEDEYTRKRNRKAEILNNWTVAGVFLLTSVNVFISAFGLNDEGYKYREKN